MIVYHQTQHPHSTRIPQDTEQYVSTVRIIQSTTGENSEETSHTVEDTVEVAEEELGRVFFVGLFHLADAGKPEEGGANTLLQLRDVYSNDVFGVEKKVRRKINKNGNF